MGACGFIFCGPSGQDSRGVFSGQRSGESGNLNSKKIFLFLKEERVEEVNPRE